MAIISGGNVMPGNGLNDPITKAGALADGNFNGQAAKGALAIDTTNGNIYINTGTQAATVWKLVTRAA